MTTTTKTLPCLLLALACYSPAGYAADPPGKSPAGGPPGAGAAPRPMSVEVMQAVVAPVNDEATAVGSLQSNEAVVIRSEIAGRIATINFQEGKTVNTGDLLFSLDASEYQAQHAQSSVSMKLTEMNFNRAKEGLRVCEDMCRFWLDDPVMTKTFKSLRHDLTKVMTPLGLKKLIAGRDIEGDVGRESTKSEALRKKPSDIFYANSQRVKESLRVLEEFAKLKSVKTSQAIKVLRYKVYGIEKKVLTSRTLDDR